MADQAAPADAPPMAMAQDPMSQAAQLQAAEAIRLQVHASARMHVATPQPLHAAPVRRLAAAASAAFHALKGNRSRLCLRAAASVQLAGSARQPTFSLPPSLHG
jgi:hypothetical protein